jgi:L-fuculokinase
MENAILVLDCGATNVRAVAVDRLGNLIASHSLPNTVHPDPWLPGGLTWDADEIWQKFAACSKAVTGNLGDFRIAAITVTTFGVDGAAMKKDGTLCYPVISWQCNRTVPVMENIGKYMPVSTLSAISGLQPFHYNTINKLIWLRENRPDVLNSADYYVLMPSVFLYKLTGQFVTDATMAGTSMLTDLKNRNLSEEILSATGIEKNLFPPLFEPGTVIGKTTAKAAAELGIGTGLPVVATGHDTQFAVYGTGAGINQPVLCSGTWEVLMARSATGNLTVPPVSAGVTVEFDAVAGFVDSGVQWVASGVLEWIGRLFYSGYPKGAEQYKVMMDEASIIPAGSEGVTVLPELFEGGFIPGNGLISGLKHTTTRAHIYRATLEALSFYARAALEILSNAGGFEPEFVWGAGGGTRNHLWNQIRADVLRLPFKTIKRSETTVLGAALFAMPAAGMYSSVEEAASAVENPVETYLPGNNQEIYKRLYSDFKNQWLPKRRP